MMLQTGVVDEADKDDSNNESETKRPSGSELKTYLLL